MENAAIWVHVMAVVIAFLTVRVLGGVSASVIQHERANRVRAAAMMIAMIGCISGSCGVVGAMLVCGSVLLAVNYSRWYGKSGAISGGLVLGVLVGGFWAGVGLVLAGCVGCLLLVVCAWFVCWLCVVWLFAGWMLVCFWVFGVCGVLVSWVLWVGLCFWFCCLEWR